MRPSHPPSRADPRPVGGGPGEPEFLRATRAGYDRIAGAYAEQFADDLDRRPEDRGLLRAFAERIDDGGGGRVLEVGCGPGPTTAFLHAACVDVTGLDLSPEMVRQARRRCPAVPFRVGSMTDLDVPAGSLAGLVAWYSLIHVPEAERPGCVAGFARALRPGGLLLVAFQVGTGTLHLEEAFGESIGLDFHRLDPDGLDATLGGAGFDVLSRTVRAPTEGERTPHAIVLARRSAPA